MPTYYFTINGVRLLDANRVDKSGSDDTMPSGKVFETSYIWATSVWGVNNKDTDPKEIRLEWRHSGGSYTPLASTGDINWVADTVLSNGTGVTDANSRCTQDTSTTYEATAVEREGANNQTIDLTSDGSSEAQWAFYVAAIGTYDFRVYDVTLGAEMKSWTITFSTPSTYTPQIMTTMLF